tara:strand:- start:2377 stop:2772 length:396 start_codon:yes stop_codon:yes gene_type:complete
MEVAIAPFKHRVVDSHWEIGKKDEFVKVFTVFGVPKCSPVSSERYFVEKVFKTLPKSEIESMDELGQRWLHWSVINNEYCVCKELLERGYDVNLLNAKNETALDVAAKLKRYLFVELLERYGGRLYKNLNG